MLTHSALLIEVEIEWSPFTCNWAKLIVWLNTCRFFSVIHAYSLGTGIHRSEILCAGNLLICSFIPSQSRQECHIHALFSHFISPCSGLEECLRFYPEQVNVPKEDGYTPLHIAAANNDCDLVSLIASSVSPVTHQASVVLSDSTKL